MKLLLASQSPRRSQLLRNAGFDFDVMPSEVEEGPPAAGETPQDYARRLAQAKGLDVATRSPAGTLVLGADTVVTIGGAILGKPADAADAARMLGMLSGKAHGVMTAISLVVAPDQVIALRHETTSVTFCAMPPEEIRAYVATGEPMDKAGAYAIQGLASKFIVRISGCYFNVVGLPISLLHQTLKELWMKP